MLPAYVTAAILILIGLSAVFWLMWTERNPHAPFASKNKLFKLKKEKPEAAPEEILERAGLRKKTVKPLKSPGGRPNFLPSILTKYFKKENPPSLSVENPDTSLKGGTASLRLDGETATVSSVEFPGEKAENPDIRTETELALKNDEMQADLKDFQEKYARLDVLFKEKNQEFERLEEALGSEKKARKDFNKVKDMMEKEIKDSKDKAKDLENEISRLEIENRSQTERIKQLEDQRKDLEKKVLEKEDSLERHKGETGTYETRIEHLQEQLKKKEESDQEKNKKIEELLTRLRPGQKQETGDGENEAADDKEQEIADTEQETGNRESEMRLAPDILSQPFKETPEDLPEEEKKEDTNAPQESQEKENKEPELIEIEKDRENEQNPEHTPQEKEEKNPDKS